MYTIMLTAKVSTIRLVDFFFFFFFFGGGGRADSAGFQACSTIPTFSPSSVGSFHLQKSFCLDGLIVTDFSYHLLIR